MEAFEHLKEEVFPDVEIGLVHGRLPSEEKDEVMRKFYARELMILVATTVIEVGIDVPTASVMVVVGGSIAAVLICFPLKSFLGLAKVLKNVFFNKQENYAELIEQIVSLAETARRDGFGAHTVGYYRRAYDLFHTRGGCELLVAEYESRPLAAIMVFTQGTRAWYFYGASTPHERNRMPTYLLQWEAMRWAKSRGCTQYDLWGVPDADRDQLEAQFVSRTDGLWGVYRFKRGFGGALVRWAGAWDRPYVRPLCALYRRLFRGESPA
jgi:hypothetical protein